MPWDLSLLLVLTALVQVALLMLLVRGILWLFGPKARKGNFVYDLLTIGTMAFIRLARKITPRLIPGAYVPAIAFLLLVGVYVGLGFAKLSLCASYGLDCSRLLQ